MIGTLLNAATVLVGGLIGLFFGARLPDRMRSTVIAGLGLFTAAIGIQMFLNTHNIIIILIALLVGAILGEWWQIEAALERLGARLQARFAADGSRGASTFVRGFLTASLVFCVGPLTILGSIQDGLTGDYSLLAVKATLDGFAALVFASTLGVGVLFSILVVLGFQGGISLLATQAQALFTDAMIAEMTAVGGILLLGIAVSSLLELKTIRVANFLPGLAIAPLIVAVMAAF